MDATSLAERTGDSVRTIWLAYNSTVYMYTVHNWLAFTDFIVVSFHYGEAVKFHTGFFVVYANAMNVYMLKLPNWMHHTN